MSTNAGRGGMGLYPFLKSKKSLDFGKKFPGYIYLWVKFLI